MLKKMILISLGFTCIISTMERSTNRISEVLHFTKHAREQMVARNISEKEIEDVLHNGIRGWDNELGAARFIERNNKSNPLVVVLNREKQPNSIITVFRKAPKQPLRKGIHGENYDITKKANKEKDLRRNG